MLQQREDRRPGELVRDAEQPSEGHDGLPFGRRRESCRGLMEEEEVQGDRRVGEDKGEEQASVGEQILELERR